MDRAPLTQIWLGRGLYLALALVLMFARLMPLDTLPRSLAAPDLLLVVTLLWAARRPRHLPAPLVVLVFLAADLIFQKPPGLNAALVLLACEWLRQREAILRASSFMVEWLHVGGVMLAIALATRLILLVLMIPQAPVALTASEVAFSILVYPLVAVAALWLIGLARHAPGEVDSLGHRL